MIKLPNPSIESDPAMIKRTLPYNGNAVTEKSFAFSFACFDREHELFNLGDNSNQCGVVRGNWFLDLIDCLKNVCNCNIYELKTSTHDLHPVDWESTNVTPPKNYEQLDFKQFRINKSKGRVILYWNTNPKIAPTAKEITPAQRKFGCLFKSSILYLSLFFLPITK